jgi:beta-galactosidase
MKLIKPMVAVCAAGFMSQAVMAQAPLPPEIENPECLGLNKEPAHATLMPYGNLKEALSAKRYSSSFCQVLNGMWKFNWVPVPDQRPVDFYKPEFDVAGWKEIPVPSNWQLEGYGTPYYRNSGYIIQRAYPHVMSEPPKDWTTYKERNPVGSYRRNFEVPANWLKYRRVFLSFDGVDSAFYLWMNGEKVGYSVNSRNAAEFDVTRFLKPGKNMVAVQVYRFSSGTWLEDQDMWRLSGIFRNVTLWSAPEVHVRDVFVKSDLDSQYRDATLQVSAKIRNYSSQPAAARALTIDLFDNQGTPVTITRAKANVPALNPGEETSVTFDIAVSNPAKWTAETPNLYTTVLELSGGNKDELISTRTGFRKVEIKGRLFTVNGVPIKLKGANRHENWPDSGHYVTEEKMIRDLEILKQGNCNHVRTCHYSDDPRWYELCDEWGIYLTAEANVECHGYYNVLDREPTTEKAIVDRNISNVENFKNHPAVILWSLGNECGGGKNFLSALAAVKAIDTTRPVHYEPFGIGSKNPADIDSRMYTSPDEVAKIAVNSNLTKPFYMCEYAHAMFNSMGAIGEYNDIFDKYPNLMGGAIWEWEDQGLYNNRDPKHPIIAYGGGFGDVPNDHYFIHKGVVFSDRTPKPHYPEMKRVYQWIGFEAEDLSAGKIEIRNKYAFITLDKFQGHWTLTEDGKTLESGKLPHLRLAPGGEESISAAFKPFEIKPGGHYQLNIAFTLTQNELWAKAGFEVATAQFQLPIQAPSRPVEVSSLARLALEQNANAITVSGKEFFVVFSKSEGAITQLTRNGVNILTSGGGPRLQLWRAPHRNDDMWAYDDWHRYGLDQLTWSTLCVNAQKVSDAIVRIDAAVKATGKNGFSVSHSAVYTIYGDGSIAVDNAIAPQGKTIPLARLGVRLLLDKQFDQVSYLGRGPFENYADRKRGADIGLYSGTIQDLTTPYAKPMENGNHEDVSWVAVSRKDGATLMAQPEGNALQFSALAYTDEIMTPVEYTIDLPPSSNTVLNLAARTLGAGSAGCGPRPLPQYIVKSEPAAFSYVLRLLPNVKELSSAGRKTTPQYRVKPVTGSRDAAGTVSLSCQTAGATLEYSLDGVSWLAYNKPFPLATACNLLVKATSASMEPFQGAISF